MEKKRMIQYLLDKKEQLRSLTVLPRHLTVQKTRQLITVIIGPRRAGKTYFLYELIKNKYKLGEADFLFVNFEDVELAGIRAQEVKEFVNVHERAYGNPPKYLFFDEVQVLENWEKLLISLYEAKQFYIFLSGSSSKILSREIATALRGRTQTYTVLPLSFSEFLEFHGHKVDNLERLSSSQENKLNRFLEEYVAKGGFPDVVLNPPLAQRFYKDYLDLVIFKDIVERYGIKNTALVKFLISTSLSSFGKVLSVHKLFNAAKSQGIEVSKKTIYSYADYLEESFFLFLLKKFSFSVKEIGLSMPKLYLNDTGISNVIASSSLDKGKLYENVVFLQLKRLQNKEPLLEIYYSKVYPHEYEVDFMLKEKNQVIKLIQVSYDLTQSKDREIRALLHASTEFNCRNLLVITHEYEGKERLSRLGVTRTVQFIPLWKWLLNRDNT